MDNSLQSEISSNLFYSKKFSYGKSTTIEKRSEFIKANPIPAVEPVGILGYTQLFKVYNKQLIALKFAKENGMGLMVFAYEGKAVGDGGRRNFLVCHPRKLWSNIKNRPLHYRCTYEVIPENIPCKLYFDLEFSKKLNKNLHGRKLVSLFICIVNRFIFKEFGVACDSNCVLDLESSTEEKFSRHLIYNHPRLYFENNYHVGRFVNDICYYLKQVYDEVITEIELPNVNIIDIKQMFVKNQSSVTLFCDRGVYTKNRNFRILGSTKYGKNSPLVVSSENKYKPNLHTQNESENWFLDSLITYVPSDIEIKRYKTEIIASKPSSLTLCDAIKQEHNSSNTAISPYPEIQKFINNYLGGENLIRSWRYFKDGELLVFDIDKRHRYCNNIRREHKSNSVMYVVNLRLGVFYQKCHDQDCKDFRSNEIKLPPETMPWKCIDEDGLASSDDEDLLLAAAAEIEKEGKGIFTSSVYTNVFTTATTPSPCNHHTVGVIQLTNIKHATDDDDDALLAAAQEIEMIESSKTRNQNSTLSSTISVNIRKINENKESFLSPWNNLSKLENKTRSSFRDTISDEEMIEFCSEEETCPVPTY